MEAKTPARSFLGPRDSTPVSLVMAYKAAEIYSTSVPKALDPHSASQQRPTRGGS